MRQTHSRQRRRRLFVTVLVLGCSKCAQAQDPDLFRRRRLQQQQPANDSRELPHLPNGFQTDGDSISIAVGPHHTCALERRPGVPMGGAARCWGRDDWGQSSPPEDAMFIQLSAGDAHTCGLKLNQQVVCWGMLPSAPAGLYLQISAGSSHTCALTHESAVVCWGDTVHGKCDAPAGYDFVQVAAGNSFSCGLRRNGLPECWGKNHMGQTSPSAEVRMSVCVQAM